MTTAKIKLTKDIVEAIMRRGEISEADVYVPLSQIEFDGAKIAEEDLKTMFGDENVRHVFNGFLVSRPSVLYKDFNPTGFIGWTTKKSLRKTQSSLGTWDSEKGRFTGYPGLNSKLLVENKDYDPFGLDVYVPIYAYPRTLPDDVVAYLVDVVNTGPTESIIIPLRAGDLLEKYGVEVD